MRCATCLVRFQTTKHEKHTTKNEFSYSTTTSIWNDQPTTSSSRIIDTTRDAQLTKLSDVVPSSSSLLPPLKRTAFLLAHSQPQLAVHSLVRSSVSRWLWKKSDTTHTPTLNYHFIVVQCVEIRIRFFFDATRFDFDYCDIFIQEIYQLCGKSAFCE